MIVARQFIAWNVFQSRIRPGGHGMILTPGGLTVLIVARLSDQTLALAKPWFCLNCSPPFYRVV
jgi:hypothetical protein